MATIRTIHIRKCRRLENIEIDLTAPDGQQAPRHLILTGPNGSGKTGLLLALKENFASYGREPHGELRRRLLGNSCVDVEWTSREPSSGITGSDPFTMLLYFGPFRRLEVAQVSGPKRIESQTGSLKVEPYAGEQLLQFLVNKRTEQAFALTDGDHAKVAEIVDWFRTFESRLRTIFDDSGMVLEFEPKRFDFRIRLSDGYSFGFRELAHGHMAALMVLTELLIRREWMRDVIGDRTYEPDGVVLIDEIETHLHLELQEIILPLLCEMFPRIQFIVATHSPAVISSVEDAVVFDLRTREPVSSSDLQGIRYGTLMTSHFGISAEYDLETTRELLELKALRDKAHRSDAEQSRLRDLAGELAQKSHALALDVLIHNSEAAASQP